MPFILFFLSVVGNYLPAPGDVELLFVGDAMQHKGQLERARHLGNDGQFDYSECYFHLKDEISNADYAVCNLELPLGGNGDYSGYPTFSAPDSYAESLKDAGFDLFLTANNHSLDRRDKGVRRTIEVLNKMGVDHIGTYDNIQQRDSLVPFIKNIKGIRIGFLNYTYGTNGITARDGAEVALIDKKKISEEIKKTREAGAELVVVAIHWGIEYVLLPNGVQKDLASFLVDEGVDMVIGGHPHVIQPMEVRHNEKEDKDVLVVYSLGNFISDMKKPDTAGGALVRTIVGRDSSGKAKFKNANYDIFFVVKPHGDKDNYQVVPSWKAELIPSGQSGLWNGFKSSALNIFNNHNIKVPRKHSDK